jgi:hypothetical protein
MVTVFVLLLVVYLAVGLVLGLINHFYLGDAWSRAGSAYYMLFSRDPHLAAIGFVWSPLPTLVLLPLVAISPLWPPLVESGFATNIMSALCMAAALVQMLGTLRDLGLNRPQRLGIVVAVGLHPMIIQYAANGMSEAPLLLFMAIAVRKLTHWLRASGPNGLVLAGSALGLAYLTRYEAALAAAACFCLVIVVSYTRARGTRSNRVSTAWADALIVIFPFAVAFALWAFASWLIVGTPFEQFSSVYGNAAQQAVNPSAFLSYAGDGPVLHALFVAQQIVGLAPVLLAIVPVSIFVAVRNRDSAILAPIIVIGGVLGFMVLAWIAGKTGPLLRYYISAVPLVALLVGATLSGLSRHARGPTSRPRSATTTLLIAFLALGIPVGALTMADPLLGRGENAADLVNGVRQYEFGREVASYVDSLEAPPGSVLVDVFLGFPIVLESANPKQFVITPDRDFKAAVADPSGYGVRYILVPLGAGVRELDAVRRTYGDPNTAELGQLVKEFVLPVGQHWRVYAVR